MGEGWVEQRDRWVEGWVKVARSMCGGSRLGFDRDGAEVENGREEEMRKKREKRESLAGPVGWRDLGGGAVRSGLV